NSECRSSSRARTCRCLQAERCRCRALRRSCAPADLIWCGADLQRTPWNHHRVFALPASAARRDDAAASLPSCHLPRVARYVLWLRWLALVFRSAAALLEQLVVRPVLAARQLPASLAVSLRLLRRWPQVIQLL